MCKANAGNLIDPRDALANRYPYDTKEQIEKRLRSWLIYKNDKSI